MSQAFKLFNQYMETRSLKDLIKRCWDKAERAMEMGTDSATANYIVFNFKDDSIVEVDMYIETGPAVRYFASLEEYNQYIDGLYTGVMQ